MGKRAFCNVFAVKQRRQQQQQAAEVGSHLVDGVNSSVAAAAVVATCQRTMCFGLSFELARINEHKHSTIYN